MERRKKNNAKFSGHYVCPRTQNVSAHALRSHQHNETALSLAQTSAHLSVLINKLNNAYILLNFISPFSHLIKNNFSNLNDKETKYISAMFFWVTFSGFGAKRFEYFVTFFPYFDEIWMFKVYFSCFWKKVRKKSFLKFCFGGANFFWGQA